MNLDPNRFENTILESERMRFNLKGYGPTEKSEEQIKDFNKKLSRKSLKRAQGNFTVEKKISKTFTNKRNRYDDQSADSFDISRDQNVTRHTLGEFRSASSSNLNAFEKMRETVDDHLLSHKLLPRSRQLYDGGLVEDHQNFRSHAFESFDNSRDVNTSVKYHTPIKVRQSKLESRSGISKLKENQNRKSVSINETFNEIQNYDPDDVASSTKDGMNSYMRKFLFKELDRIREDSHKSNSNLSKNIAENEEFYSTKLEELKRKLKADIVPADDIQRLVDHAVEK